ncbi:hypothetical protein ABR737_04005 [Streptomyces sp. Edi2]|uniref:hypothetical protein n=1 Tax=Streptomyces sp. Edi2 TaxID=3162528 RepID=UPI0033067AEF
MSPELDAEHAARALEDVQRRRDQAIEAQRQPRWFSIAWGAHLFLVLATPDLLPLLHLERWWPWCFGVLAPLTTAFLIGQYTRWGRSLLGLPPGLQMRGIIPPGLAERRTHRRMVVFFGVAAVVILTCGVLLTYIPYWHLLMGIALGLATVLQSNRQSERLKSLGHLGYAHDRS